MTLRTSALAVAAALFLAACTPADDADRPSGASEPEELTPAPAPWVVVHRTPRNSMFGVAWNPAELRHPLLTTNRVMRELYNLMYDGLFALDRDFTARERLCAEISTTDNITFILRLRQDVMFNNGEPLTAGDVISSIQTARSPASPYSARLAGVVSVRAAGEDIEIVLDAPNPRFSALLTFPVAGAAGAGLFPAGTGPYEHIWDPDNERDYLVPFAGHWAEAKPPLERIELIAADKPEDLPHLMGARDLSVVTEDINDDFGVRYSGDYDMWEYPTPTMYYIGFNTDHPLLAHSAVRQALSAAFDRAGLVREVFGGAADAASLPVPPAVYGSGANFDLKVFARVMQELDVWDSDNDGILEFRQGRLNIPFTLEIITEESDTRATASAEYIAAELVRSGVGAEVGALTSSAYRNAKESGSFGLYCERITLTADFSVRRWLETDPASRALSDYAAFYDETPIAPLLFKRGYALTHRSAVSGIAPVYGDPYANIYDWTVRQ